MSGAFAGRPIVVTGGAGFIGSALCQMLVDTGHAVVAYDDLSRGRREFLPASVTLAQGDIRDQTRLRAVLGDVNPVVVIHLAAMHFIPDCVARPDDTRDVNITGTRVVLEGCRDAGVEHVVFASTAAVYAPSDDACREDGTPLGPLEVYGESKLAGEQLVRGFHEATGIAASMLRLFNAVGPRETNPHVIPHIIESLRVSNAVALGNVSPRRDYIDTRDIAAAILSVLRSPAGMRVFNVGSGSAHSVTEIVKMLGEQLGRPVVIHQEPARVRPSERMTLLADITRIRRETGWAPAIPLEQALRHLAIESGLPAGTSLVN